MKMKNVLMILIALAMVFTMVGVVSATTSINPDEQILDGKKDDSGNYINNAGNAYVNYTVSDAFEVIVPASVDFNNKLFKVHTINVTKSLIGYDKYLHVNLSSLNYENGFKLVTGKNSNQLKSSIPYNITYEGSVNQIDTNPCTVLTVQAGSDHTRMGVAKAGYGIGGFVELNFTTTKDYIDMATMSGLHQDTLRFMFWVDTQSN